MKKNFNIKENKVYRLLWLEDNNQLILIKSDGLIRIYKRYEDEKGNYHDTIWLDDGYKDLYIIMKCGVESDKKYCYVRLIDENGTHSIMEIVSKEAVLNEYQYNHYKIVFAEIESTTFGKSQIKDVIFRVLIKKKKIYALYSLKEGYIFGPHKYENIETLHNGVILDDNIAVENCGSVVNLADFEENGSGVYVSKDKKKYLLFLDQKDVMFVPMEEDMCNSNIMIAETDYEIFKYDKKTGECKCELFRPIDNEIDWSQYNDTVYEGHSRLELGLED